MPKHVTRLVSSDLLGLSEGVLKIRHKFTFLPIRISPYQELTYPNRSEINKKTYQSESICNVIILCEIRKISEWIGLTRIGHGFGSDCTPLLQSLLLDASSALLNDPNLAIAAVQFLNNILSPWGTDVDS